MKKNVTNRIPNTEENRMKDNQTANAVTKDVLRKPVIAIRQALFGSTWSSSESIPMTGLASCRVIGHSP